MSVEASDILGLADHFGPWVVLAAVMVWDKVQDRKAQERREDKDRELGRERIATDRVVASAMSDLASEVRGMRR